MLKEEGKKLTVARLKISISDIKRLLVSRMKSWWAFFHFSFTTCLLLQPVCPENLPYDQVILVLSCLFPNFSTSYRLFKAINNFVSVSERRVQQLVHQSYKWIRSNPMMNHLLRIVKRSLSDHHHYWLWPLLPFISLHLQHFILLVVYTRKLSQDGRISKGPNSRTFHSAFHLELDWSVFSSISFPSNHVYKSAHPVDRPLFSRSQYEWMCRNIRFR